MHSLTGLIVARKDAPVRVEASRRIAVWSNSTLLPELTRLGVRLPENLTQLYMLGPSGVESLVGDGPLISDERPSIEFHPPRHQLLEHLGSYTPDAAAALEVVYGLRQDETFPLDGVDPGAQKAIQKLFDVQSVLLQGDLQMDIEHPAEARRIYEGGLAFGREARPIFLLAMALAERELSNIDEARRLLNETLALEPANERARTMLDEINTPTGPP
jgi:hypothetical protein